jgi:hypothetical protein
MYLIPKSIDLSFLLEADLNQIGLGRHDVQFVFSSGARICVQGRASVLEHGSKVSEWSETGWSSLDFQKLLNRSVSGFSVPNDRLLQIEFTNGLSLQLHDNSNQYESMQIYTANPDVPLIVI